MASFLRDITDRFRGFIIKPGDEEYERVIHRSFANEERQAAIVFQPICESDVSLALQYATTNNLEVAVASGGFSFMGASGAEGGVTIDLRRMNGVSVDNQSFGASGVAIIEGGATVGKVAEELDKHGTCTTYPAHTDIGYTGFALGVGVGWAVGLTGAAVDNIIEARVVISSGEVVTASKDTHPDLFWAIRGAGYNFGVVTQLKIRVLGKPSKVFFGFITYPPSSFEAVFQAAEFWVKDQNEDVMALFATFPPGPPGLDAELRLMPYHHGSDEVEARHRYKAFFDIPHIKDETRMMWAHETTDLAPEATWIHIRTSSNGTMFTSLSPDIWLPVLAKMRAWVESDEAHRMGTVLYLGAYDWNKMLASDVRSESAWPRRQPPNGEKSWRDCAMYLGWGEQDDDAVANQASKDLLAFIRQQHAKVVGSDMIKDYAYPNGALLPEFTGEYIFRENYTKLQRIKGLYDPNNVFHKKHPIKPVEQV